MARRRGWVVSMLTSILLLVGGGSLGFAGGYWWYSQAPAPMPVGGGFDKRGDSTIPTSDSKGAPPAGHVVAEDAPQLAANMLAIPSLSASAPLDFLGVADGELLLPEPSRLALYEDGSYPGDPHGTVLVAGHVNSHELGRGALFELSKIKPDAAIWVTGQDGRGYEYRVTTLTMLDKEALPQDIFTRNGEARLVIVTCGGRVVSTPKGRFYESNVIATAVPTGRVS